MKKLYFSTIAILLFAAANAQTINILDANFKTRLLSSSNLVEIAKDNNGNNLKIDVNNNGEIEQSEANLVFGLDLNSFELPANKISDLTGIAAFTNLTDLNCGGNALTVLDLTPLSQLVTLFCASNQITILNVSSLLNLREIYAYNNNLFTVNVLGLIALRDLDLEYNHLQTLDLTGLDGLELLNFANNDISQIELDNLLGLSYLDCSGNHLTTLNVSRFPQLSTLFCSSNDLESIDMKNGSAIDQIQIAFDNNPNLHYICVDEAEFSQIQQMAATAIGPGCVINSYCSFTPGGTSYTIQGNVKYDMDNNGCSTMDINYANLKFNVSNGLESGNIVADRSGQYAIPVVAGTQTIIPQLEDSAYFTILPATATVTFPETVSPFIQDFCITANGVHNDLEITILPIGIARPGFDAVYKILIKNKGNQTQSGSAQLSYDDAVLDFVSSNPSVLLQTAGLLVFDFDALQPFTSKEIFVTFNVNSPLEIPAVNSGAILHYTASIITATDETPADNIFILNQIVVNSLDPNDKTCLEGTTITPEMVGKDVHYIIRFENTGTANAENIVVKDMIDIAKFDVDTLIPIDGSAPFTTRINGSKVEFIFENINLPFAAGSNDGYVAFKIKTKPALVLGDTFDNTASIYFDYNAPIITNTATTTVAFLAAHDFVFEDYFKIYPNPAKTVLNISTKKQIDISSISIYNVLGQLVLAIPNARQISTVDVSGLKTGNYFIKIISDKGASNAKFIKN